MQSLLKKQMDEFVQTENNIIKEALSKNGITNFSEDFIKNNLMLINNENDSFTHLYFHYGQPDEKRIISIERQAQLTEDNSKGIRITATKKYY